MESAVLELVEEAERVADFLEQVSSGYQRHTHRFAPELRNLAPGLRSKAKAVVESIQHMTNISPKPGEQTRDFLKNSRGMIVGVQCLVVDREGNTCGELLSSIQGFKTHFTRRHGADLQGCLDLFGEEVVRR